MDRDKILAALVEERNRLDKAIDALMGVTRHKGGDWSREKTYTPRKPMSAAAKKKIAKGIKAAWKKRKAEAKEKEKAE